MFTFFGCSMSCLCNAQTYTWPILQFNQEPFHSIPFLPKENHLLGSVIWLKTSRLQTKLLCPFNATDTHHLTMIKRPYVYFLSTSSIKEIIISVDLSKTEQSYRLINGKMTLRNRTSLSNKLSLL